METATPSSKARRHPRPALARSLYADFRKGLAEAKAHLARIDEMIRRNKVTFVYVPKTKVREHTRSGYWRPYYPPLRRTAS